LVAEHPDIKRPAGGVAVAFADKNLPASAAEMVAKFDRRRTGSTGFHERSIPTLWGDDEFRSTT
jgi:hypothetical protein